MSTLWSKGTQATDLVEDFTVGNDRILDMRLAKYDVQGSMAHIRMLESIGLLTSDELETLTASLQQILSEIEGISICKLTNKDVVRHPLVQNIINAYEKYEKKQEYKNKHGK